MKETIYKFAESLVGETRVCKRGFLKLALWSCTVILSMGGTVRAQQAPLNDNFTNAIVISGSTGSTSGKNINATLQTPAESATVATADNGTVTVGNSVWFEWTAPTTGNATFDTIGSSDVNFNTMDTVLKVSTGATLASQVLVGANDNVSASSLNSSVTFYATAGITYYITVDLNLTASGQPGTYLLNWTERAAPIAGAFRLTSPSYAFSARDGGSGVDDPRGLMQATPAHATITRVGGANGKVNVTYKLEGGTYTNIYITNIYVTNMVISTVDSNGLALGSITNLVTTNYNATESYQNYTPANGYFYTTRQSSGVLFSITNIDGVPFGKPFSTNGLPFNPGLAISCGQNPDITTVVDPATSNATTTTITYDCETITATQIVSSVPGLTLPVTNVVTFNDFQMNEDVSLQFGDPSLGVAYLANPYFRATLLNVALDLGEDPTIPSPIIQSSRSSAIVAILSSQGSPYIFGNDAATNSVINFERATLRCDKTVRGSGIAYVGVKIGGVSTLDRKAYYEIDHSRIDDDLNTFTLQAGSDYARPDNASKYIASSDFTSVKGVIDWPANDTVLEKFIQIPITQDNLVKFNRDFQVHLYLPPGVTFKDLNAVYGYISDCNVTILYTTPPAGANDTSFNADNNALTSPPFNQNPGANGIVYAAVVHPLDGKTVIGGDFSGYNNASGAKRNHIARLNTDGQLDLTFDPGSGFDGDVEALAIGPDQLIVAVGAFHSFNGSLRKGIARINLDGSLDTSFNPGRGADSTIWSTTIQPDGKILVCGDFATFNSTNRNYIARLNPDGSVDSTFDPGVGPNGDVFSMAVQANGQIVIGGVFTSVDGVNLNYIARLNSDGTLDPSFNPGYGFGADNIVNAVAVQPDGKILLGGSFTHVGNLGGQGLARLNSDGTVDTGFYTGTGANDEVNTINLQSDGTILIGGWFTTYNQTRRIGFARVLPNGLLDTGFLDTAYNQFAGLINNYFDPNVNPPNPVYTLAQQPDGNIIVGGSFYQIGGGGTRDDVHARQNVARVVGGYTPGPGNVELSLSSYTADSASPSFFVQVDRTNGSLGSVSATVATVPTGSGTGYAAYGVDYTFNPAAPVWGVTWSNDSWMLSDGLSGTNNNLFQINPLSNKSYATSGSSVTVNIISNNNNNVSLSLAMTQPKIMDTFFLGGASAAGVNGFGGADTAEGENIPLAVGLGVITAPMTIIHNNPHPGVFNFSASSYYFIQKAGTATITVTRTGGTDNSVTVHYSTSDGTATANTDYRTATGTLTFPAGVSTQTFNVTLIAASGNKPDRIFNVNISTPGNGAALGTVTNAQVELVNANFASGHIEFVGGNINSVAQTISYGTNENNTALLATVARLGGAVGTLNINVATKDGTAKNGVNFIGFTNVLTWTNGDASSKTVAVPLIDDGITNGNLLANIYLFNPIVSNTNAPLAIGGVYTNASLVISNIDSPGTVEFTTGSYTVNENAGYAIVPVIRTGGTIGSLTVSYQTIDGTAVSGVNYVGTNGTLQFSPGQTSTNFIVWIKDQSTAYAVPLNFQMALTSLGGSSQLGTPSVAQMNINGSDAINNPPGTTDLGYSTSAGFNDSVFALALQPDGKLLAGGNFTTADGVPRNRLARLNSDGSLDTAFSSYLPNFGADSTIRSIVVQDNGLILLGGFFTNYNSTVLNHIARINLNGTVDSSFNAGAGSDNPVYAMASTYVGGLRKTIVGGGFTLINGYPLNSIARLNDNGSVDTGFNPGLGANGTVYALAVQTDGKIVIGGDFTAVNGTTINHIARLNQDGSLDSSFNVGTGASDSVRAIAIQLDGQILIGGLFTNVNNSALNHLARLKSNGALDPAFKVGSGANGNVETILMQADTRILVGGDFTVCSGVTRNRITRLNPDGTVDSTVNFGLGADSFIAAAVLDADGKVDIGGGFSTYDGDSHQHLARIYGGSLAGSGGLQFSSSSFQVDEKGTNVLISIIRNGGTSGNNPDGTGNIVVHFATSDGSGVAGINYSSLSTNVVFPAGEVLRTISLPVFDDGLVTTNLTVSLTLTNPTSPAVIGSVPSATLYIINDDSSVSFSSASYTVAKNVPGGSAIIGLVRQGSDASTNTVNFATLNGGTALIGTDYTPVNQSVTFAPGVKNVTVTVPINNNGIAEGNRTIPMQLSNPLATFITSPSNAVLTIIDTVNVPGQFAFSATNYNVTEGGGSGVSTTLITVLRTNGSSGIVSVAYTTLDGTAFYATKYIPTNGVLTFGDGETAKSFVVQAFNTTTAEGPEYFNLLLSNPTGGAGFASPSNSIVTIINTNIGIAFVSATNSFTEPSGFNQGTVVLNVVRYNNTNDVTTVNYTTVDGTAQSNVNYLSRSGTLTFNPGESIKSIFVPTLYDPRVTGDLTFTAALSLPDGSKAQLTSPSVATVIDHDANSGLSFFKSEDSVFKNAGFQIIYVICSNTNAEPLTVNYSTGGGTAVPGVDYTATSGTLTFTNGQFYNYFFVPILPNTLVQSNKTYIATLSQPSGLGVLVYPSIQTNTIVNTNTPYGLSFSSPIIINGSWGSTNADNTLGSSENGDPAIAQNQANAPVWFQWTAPADGEVTLDTFGSVATNGLKLDTVLGVYTGSSLNSLSQVAVNDDLYTVPPSQTSTSFGQSLSSFGQENEGAQNIFNTNLVVNTNFFGIPPQGKFSLVSGFYYQPFGGPSGLRFNAKAGVTYFIAADTKLFQTTISSYPSFSIQNLYNVRGIISLNWAYHSSGVFRFASENMDQTGLFGASGNPLLLYQCAESESQSSSYEQGPVDNVNEYKTVHDTYYVPDAKGLLVTVTRVSGSSGRVSVDYATVDGDPNVITNGDLPAVAGKDYTAKSGTLIFDDFEMSKTILVPITDDNRQFQPNRDFTVVLTNAQRDPFESGEVSAPRVDPTFGTVLCRILDRDIDPKGPVAINAVTTNIFGIVTTNLVGYNLQPTNAVCNFSKTSYRIPRDEATYFGNSVPITLYVTRSGTNEASQTLHWRLDSVFLNKDSSEDANYKFPLQPGSDYAVPTPANASAILGTNSDFAGVGGDSGTITFPAKNNQFNQGKSPKIQFTLNNHFLTTFNRDILVSLYDTDSKGNPIQSGMINQAIVTILFDDTVPPAGSVDQLYNPDFAVNLLFPTNSGKLGSAVVNPGTELYSEVYSLVVLPNNGVTLGNQSLIAGAFTTYSDANNTYTVNGIARLNQDGTLDTTFNSGSGVNVFPGGEFIRVALLTTSNSIVIGGDFSSYNGVQRNSIARLNSDGSLDSTFNPGSGVNGTIWAMALQPDGKVLIGGDFTTFNSNQAKYLARINTDGTLDPTFNAGTNFNSPIYAIALQNDNSIIVGGEFTSFGGRGGQNRIVRLKADGSQDITFNTVTGPSAAVRSLAIQPDGKILAGGEFKIVAGQSANHIVRFNANGSLDSTFNGGSGTDGTVSSINYNVFTNLDGTITSSIYVGGTFTVFNGTHRLGFTRLYPDGTVDTSFLDTAYNQFAGLPRIFFADSPGTVYASGVQDDGNVLIVGSFQQVGGGQADKNPRNYLEQERGLTGSFSDPNLWVSEGGTEIEPKSRDGVRNRGNVARLIGGATPGPGNIGMVSPSYSVNKSTAVEALTLVRTNGSLGFASANFSVIPGLAKSGSDYSFSSLPPIYPIDWEYNGPSRNHIDGQFGQNGVMRDTYGSIFQHGFTGPASININILKNPSSLGNLSAQLQLANPVGADQFYLGGQNIPVGVALGESVAPLILVDNSHQDGVFGFGAPNFVATNSPATALIVRTNSSIGTVQLSYQTVLAGSTAVPGVDYKVTNGVVSFNPGQTSNTFPISILENSYITNVEKIINLQLYNLQDLSGGNASLGVTNAVVRIINPNFQGYLNLTTNYYSANLSALSVSFSVARTVGSKGSLTVQYATTNGTAISGVDYTANNGTLNWDNGDVSTRTVSVAILPNSLIGPNKQFAVNIFNPTINNTNLPSLLGTLTNAILNIINDNNSGTFQFSASQYRVNENGGYATITVTRTGSAMGSTAVNFATADSSALAGLNYVATNGVLTFTNGQLSSSFNITVKNDSIVDPSPANFYFNVVLTTNGTAGVSLGSINTATVNIVDAQTFNQLPGSADPTFDPNVNFNGSVLALALQSNGQIVAGGVFTSVNGANLNHIARLNTDGTLDTAFLSGYAGANGFVNAVVSQSDDRILIGGAFSSVDGSVRNHIARLMTDGSLDTSFVPGSGADNAVFALAETFINGSRELYAGGSFSTFNGLSRPGLVRLNNDGSVDAGFATGVGANGTVYSVAPYPVNAVNNGGKILVGGSFTNFNNVIVGNLVRLNLNGSVDTSFNNGGNILANGAVRAIAIQSDGGILIGGDFTAVNGVPANHLARLTSDGKLDTVFAANLITGVNGTVNAIVVQPDNRIVVAGQFNKANNLNRNSLTRLLPTGSVDPTINFGDGANGAINAVVLQPTDGFFVIGGAFTQFNDQNLQYIARLNGGSIVGSGQFVFSSANYQIDEVSGFATITVIRTGGSSGPNADGSGDIFVPFSTSDGTAKSGVNYYSVITNLDFPLGEVFKTINIPVIDDGVVTNNLVANLTLSSPTAPAGLGDQSTAQLTIINDDSGVSFLAPSFSVPKNTVNGVATIDIIRQGSTSGSCSVNFATATNGTAVIGLDYFPTNGTVNFGPGESDKTVQVQIINNNIPEGQRTVALILTNATGVVLANPKTATLTIIDTVNAPGELDFATNSYTVVEANSSVLLTVIRTNGASGIVSINYNTVSGTALPGINYLTSSGTLTLGDGVTSGTISIPLVDNFMAQGAVNFSVNLSNPAGGATLGLQTNSIVNVLDNDIGVTFQTATNFASESSGAAVVFVQRLGATNIAFSVNYATYDITAISGTNYLSVSSVLNFGSGETLKAVSIPLINDPMVTGDLFFGIRLTNATAGAQLAFPTNAIVVIHDADAGFSFSNSVASVLNTAGTITIPVICSNPSIEPVIVDSNTVPLMVNYFTTNGTATAGIHYSEQHGTLVFTNGIGTNYFTVGISNLTFVGDKTFRVVLTQPTAPGKLVAPSTETITIVDRSSGVSFSSPSYTVNKTNIFANIDVFRTGYTDSIVTVNYSATNGSAVNGVNFLAVSGTLMFTNGVVKQSFSIPIISSTVRQPDLTVFLQLYGATNAATIYPYFSVLTIKDLNGSTILPSGAVLVQPEGFIPANGIIDPGETNTLLFAFRVGSGTNLPKMVATLLATNGITQPSPVSQTYSNLVAGGHAVSAPFKFTASGTNGQAIVATFLLTDGSNIIDTNTFTFNLGTWKTTYSNSAPIIINDVTTANPYPSTINILGLNGIVLHATVTLTNLYHKAPGDIEALVVAPNQQDTILMANSGAGNAVNKVTLIFDDAATNSLPDPNASTTITNGVYKPTKNGTLILNFP